MLFCVLCGKESSGFVHPISVADVEVFPVCFYFSLRTAVLYINAEEM